MPVNTSANNALAKHASLPHKLELTINGKPVSEAGQYVPKAEAQQAPILVLEGADKTKTYAVVALDMDAPFPSWSGLGPIVHWIQHDFKTDDGNVLRSDAQWIIDYIGPAPPPLSGPHRYCFFVYEQHSAFSPTKHAPVGLGNKVAAMKRMRFDLDNLEREAGLGEPIACNWFTSN